MAIAQHHGQRAGLRGGVAGRVGHQRAKLVGQRVERVPHGIAVERLLAERGRDGQRQLLRGRVGQRREAREGTGRNPSSARSLHPRPPPVRRRGAPGYRSTNGSAIGSSEVLTHTDLVCV